MFQLNYRKKRKLCDALFVLPGLLLFTTFTYYPLLVNVGYSLTSWNGRSEVKEFVGLKNFISIFQDATVMQAVENTFYLAILNLALGVVLNLIAALILYNRVRGHNVLKVLLYIPAVLSPIVMSYTWKQFLQYNGYINQFLELIGSGELATSWLLQPDSVKLWLVLISRLAGVGSGMLYYLAGLNSIPKEIYEAAELDGAKGFKKFFHITFPLIMPSVTVALFLNISSSLQIYSIPQTLTQGGPMGSTTTVVMSIREMAFGFNRFGYASAMSVLFFMVIAVITVIQLTITRKREVQY